MPETSARKNDENSAPIPSDSKKEDKTKKVKIILFQKSGIKRKRSSIAHRMLNSKKVREILGIDPNMDFNKLFKDYRQILRKETKEESRRSKEKQARALFIKKVTEEMNLEKAKTKEKKTKQKLDKIKDEEYFKEKEKRRKWQLKGLVSLNFSGKRNNRISLSNCKTKKIGQD